MKKIFPPKIYFLKNFNKSVFQLFMIFNLNLKLLLMGCYNAKQNSKNKKISSEK